MSEIDTAGITIGVDIGTTAVKAVAAGPDGRVLARSRVSHELIVTGAGVFEHIPQQAWVEGPVLALEDVMMQLQRDFGEQAIPVAVCVAAMAPSLCAVDATGVPVSPGLLYGDYRGRIGTGSRGAASSSPIPDDAYGFLAALASTCPDAAGYWPAQAVANHALCDRAVMDSFSALAHSPLSGDSGWDTGVLASLGVPESKLPLIAPAGAAVGELGELAPVLSSRHIVVASGTVDALAEQMAVGKLHDGDVLIVLGSTLLIWVQLSEWKEVDGLWTVPDLFDLAGSGCLAGGASNAGGMFVDWVGSLLGRRAAGNDSASGATNAGGLGAVSRDVLSAEPLSGCGQSNGALTDPGGIPVWAPYPRGERTPLHDPERRAALSGLGLEHGPEAVMRAAFEASGFVVKRHIELAGCEPRRILVTGGGIQSDGWLQAIADCTGVPVDAVSVPEGAALGAAFMARIACGLEPPGALPAGWQQVARRVDPDGCWAGKCSERYERFLEMSV
ncbi:MAG: xylulokinase [Acidimicrobiales bacterium]